jgi:hypothetical protein
MNEFDVTKLGTMLREGGISAGSGVGVRAGGQCGSVLGLREWACVVEG